MANLAFSDESYFRSDGEEVNKMSDNTNFFDKPVTDDSTAKDAGEKPEEGESKEPETVKVGDKEYSQEDLGNLVGLGQKFQEIETKQGQPVNEIIKSWGDRGNRIGELKTELEESKKQEINKKEEAGEELSPEEQKRKALVEADNLGLVHKDSINQYIDARLDAVELLAETKQVVTKAEEDGKPKTDSEALLKHMQGTGIKSPEKAYKDMFETELDTWKEKQLDKIKKPGMVTEDSSTAGSKKPEPVKVNRDNLDKLLKAHFN